MAKSCPEGSSDCSESNTSDSVEKQPDDAVEQP